MLDDIKKIIPKTNDDDFETINENIINKQKKKEFNYKYILGFVASFLLIAITIPLALTINSNNNEINSENESSIPTIIDNNKSLLTSLDEHYDVTFDKLTLTKEKYEKNKDFFGSNVRYYMLSSRHILIYEPGEYRIEIFLKVQLNGKEVLKKNSIKFTAIRQDDKDK